MPRLVESEYLKFPFTVSQDGPKTSKRKEHVREQIEQVLFTNPRERVFRPEFGVGVRRMVFEPNNLSLRNNTIKRLEASLAEALFGEVDPKTLEIEVKDEDSTIYILISYVLAAINVREAHTFVAGTTGGNNG